MLGKIEIVVLQYIPYLLP